MEQVYSKEKSLTFSITKSYFLNFPFNLLVEIWNSDINSITKTSDGNMIMLTVLEAGGLLAEGKNFKNNCHNI